VITGTTRLAAVIGSPIRHSLSPALHNAAFEASGLDWRFVAFEVEAGRGRDALEAMRVLRLGGLSVTMPHKEDVFAAVDVVEASAAALRSVNCVVPLDDGRLLGTSTDGDGFVESLRRDGAVDPAGLRVVVLGAGGAGRAVVDALARSGAASIGVVNRTASRAEEAAALAGAAGRVATLADVGGADLVVNATSQGMGAFGSESSALPLDPSSLHEGQVVADLVYHPLDTALLQAARAAGARTHDGLGMLVHQAALQFQRYTGVEADPAVMRAAAERELASRPAV
jgi:shikimate dehydrogenase